MKLQPFKAEKWINDHENDCIYNLTESCVQPFKMEELLNLLGIKEKYIENLLNTTLDYGPINGSDSLKEQISKLYEHVSVENIALAQGGNNANMLVVMELFDKNDEIITFTPSYEQFSSLAKSIHATVISLPLYEEKNWMYDLNEIEKNINSNTKAIVLINPNNPTGTVLSESDCLDLVKLARKYDLYIISDEAYRGMIVDGKEAKSFADYYEKAIVTSGLSKTYALPALRIGWIIGPKEFIERIIIRRDYDIISLSKMNDMLASEVLKQKNKVIKRNIDICLENRKIIQKWMKTEPHITNVFIQGTTQLIKYDIDMKSEMFAELIQKETGIFFVPGACYNSEYHLRLGGGLNPVVLKEGLEVFSKWLRKFDQ